MPKILGTAARIWVSDKLLEESMDQQDQEQQTYLLANEE